MSPDLELVATQRAWAVQLLTKRPGWTLDAWLQLVAECTEPVQRLIGSYLIDPVGECSSCGKRAPLRISRGSVELLNTAVCSWGCRLSP